MTISFLLITGIVEHVPTIHFSLHVTEILKDIRDEIVNHTSPSSPSPLAEFVPSLFFHEDCWGAQTNCWGAKISRKEEHLRKVTA